MQKNNKPRVDKITIVYSRPPRKEPREGDRKMIKGVMHVRRAVVIRECGRLMSLTSRGKQVYEWVTEETYNKGYKS